MNTSTKISLEQAASLKQNIAPEYQLVNENSTKTHSIFKAYKNFKLHFSIYIKLPVVIEINELKKLAEVSVYPKMKKAVVIALVCLVLPILISFFLNATAIGLFIGIFLALEIYLTFYFFVNKQIKQIRKNILS